MARWRQGLSSTVNRARLLVNPQSTNEVVVSKAVIIDLGIAFDGRLPGGIPDNPREYWDEGTPYYKASEQKSQYCKSRGDERIGFQTNDLPMLRPTSSKVRKREEHVYLDEMTNKYNAPELFTGETYPSVKSYSKGLKDLVNRCLRYSPNGRPTLAELRMSIEKQLPFTPSDNLPALLLKENIIFRKCSR
ncbi:hypothetical protein AOQ84DRAFT_378277 [Glonium stellatum]|uniref:Protein kinase domain-containing protein n=1 Tax=Glonium stellatum TaxID=574774 RepID=A0A8E2EXJ9_9PEZI|nr:hypothetical protein AOQ84DRAFT_378277 [Glonium stellatum]